MKRKLGYAAYIFLQWTWGLPQTLAGLIVFLMHRKEPHSFQKGCIQTEWSRGDGVSLGMFTFVAGADKGSPFFERMSGHEYGHALQSLMLGPFYLVVIGIPSFLWNQLPYFETRRRARHHSYYDFFPERWADHLGKVKRK